MVNFMMTLLNLKRFEPEIKVILPRHLTKLPNPQTI